MGAPVLQAEGNITAVTTGTITPVIPAHQTNDIIVVTAQIWAPNTTGDAAQIPVPAGYGNLATPLGQPAASPRDGWFQVMWKRAASNAEANPTLSRGASWDTGTDTLFAARCYLIRGCVTSGNPTEFAAFAGPYTAANGALQAITLAGIQRLAIHFLFRMENVAITAGVPTGWTQGTVVSSATGTGARFNTFRKDNQSANTGADVTNAAAVTAGAYAFAAFSFVPAVVNYSQPVDDTFALADSIVKTPHIYVPESYALADSVKKAPVLAKGEALALADGVVKSPTVKPSDSVSLSDAVVKAPRLNKSETYALVDQVAKSPGVAVADPLALADSVVKAPRVVIAEALALADQVRDALALHLADAMPLTDSVSSTATFHLSVADSIDLLDALAKTIRARQDDSLVLSDALAKAVVLSEADTLAFADDWGIGHSFKVDLADNFPLADQIRDTIALALNDSMALDDSVARTANYLRSLTATINFTDATALRPLVSLSDSMSFADALRRAPGLGIADPLPLNDLVSPSGQFNLALADQLTLTDDFQRVFGHTLSLADTIPFLDEIAFDLFRIELLDYISLGVCPSCGEGSLRPVKGQTISGIDPSLLVAHSKVDVWCDAPGCGFRLKIGRER